MPFFRRNYSSYRKSYGYGIRRRRRKSKFSKTEKLAFEMGQRKRI